MDDKKFDELLGKSLKQQTDSASQMKDQIWNNIERRMLEQDIQEYQATGGISRMKTHKKKSRAKSWFAITAAAGVILATLFTVSTESGQAFISQIRQMFEPEKKMIENLEGMEEETNVTLHENETNVEREADYVIYVDEERYVVTKEDGVQRISQKDPADYIPDVYMEITQDKDRQPREIIEELKEQLTGNYETVIGIEEVNDPVRGYKVQGIAGNQWDDEVEVYYVVSNEIEGSFIIKQMYFLEASEGHGVRMNDMLREFEVVIQE